jgi:hypothetical protein
VYNVSGYFGIIIYSRETFIRGPPFISPPAKSEKRNNKIIPKKQQNKLNKTTKLNIQTELVSSMENKGRDN